ncbi:MAG: hypothetical protein ACKVS9_15210 [Phycisphaerae bacterium]
MLSRRPDTGWPNCPRCDATLDAAQRTDARCRDCNWHVGSCNAVFQVPPRVIAWRPIVGVAILAAVIAFVSPAINCSAVRAGENEPTLFVVLIGAVVCFALIRGFLAWSRIPRVLFNQDGVTFDGTGLPREPIAWHDFETVEVTAAPVRLRLSASWDYVAAEIASRDLGGVDASRAIADAIMSMRPRSASVA